MKTVPHWFQKYWWCVDWISYTPVWALGSLGQAYKYLVGPTIWFHLCYSLWGLLSNLWTFFIVFESIHGPIDKQWDLGNYLSLDFHFYPFIFLARWSRVPLEALDEFFQVGVGVSCFPTCHLRGCLLVSLCICIGVAKVGCVQNRCSRRRKLPCLSSWLYSV